MTENTETPRLSAVVTGSSRGIGRAVAEELARAGFDVCVNCSSERGLDEARAFAAALEADHGVRTLTVAANVADAAEAEGLVAAAHESFGRVDVLVNNAGITRDGLLARMKEEDFDAVIDVNLKGTFNCCKAAAQRMMKQRYGRIVNLSSVVGVAGNAGQANYAASKAGVIGLTKSIARELAARNITANAVAPGFDRTDMTDALSEKQREAIVGRDRLEAPRRARGRGRARPVPGERRGRLHHRTGCLHRRRYVAMSENSMSTAATRRPDGTHRVVITGMGAVSPAGVGVEALWRAVMGKECCIGPVTRFDTADYDVHIAAEVRDFDATEHGITKKEARRFERFVQYAIVASDEALAQSGLDLETEDTTRIACVFGTGIGGIDELQSGFFTLAEKGPKRVSPLFIPTMIGNIAAGNLSIRYGLRGECLNVVTACATGAHSIGAAVRDIRHGYIDAALAGGSEESVSPICLAGFANLGALSKAEDAAQASLPFDVRRAGFVAGEGAGAVVVESLEHALGRGATVLAEITGFGSTGDAYHMTAPEPSGEGVTRAMRQALEEGGFSPEDLGHVNAHGTGTPANDATESKALLALCGEDAGVRVPVTSVKGTTGHTLGAAGAIEAIVTALSVMHDCVPPPAASPRPTRSAR